MLLGVLIFNRRKRMGISRAEISRRTGLNLTGIYKIERNKNLNPRFKTIIALATELNITFDELKIAFREGKTK